MTSLERVKRSIHFEGPDRVPHHLYDGRDNDMLWFWFPQPPDISPWETLPDGRQRRIDVWGVTWETMGGGSFGEAVAWPLADLNKQDEYTIPDLLQPSLFDAALATIKANSESTNPKYCLGVMPYHSLYEGTHNLTGLANLMVAFYEEPTLVHKWIARLAAAQREAIKLLAELGCHGVMGYDDWGLQDRLMVNPKIFREFFLPHYRENWQLAHSLGMDVWLHSCGYIIEILPLLHEAGLNVIQMDQQENMGLHALDAVVGGRLAFWCPVDIQKTMVHGTPQDITRYVQLMITTLGAHTGGFISMAYSSPDAVGHTKENTAVMSRAFRQYGVYGSPSL